MKSLTSLITVSLMLATGSVIAQEPVKGTAPPAANPQAMDHGKMGMSGMSEADHQKMAMAQFAKLDTNNDGSLSKTEFAKHHAMMGMQHGSMGHGMMDMQHGRMDHSKMDHSKMEMAGMKAVDHQKMAAEQFATLDKNQDGKLSKGEIPADHPLAAHFGMLDANKDGSVSKAEFATHHGM